MKQHLKQWWEHLTAGWLLPLKPKHVDRLAEARRKRFAHIKRRPPQRHSFRRYWREQGNAMALHGLPRRFRRSVVLRWYRKAR